MFLATIKSIFAAVIIAVKTVNENDSFPEIPSTEFSLFIVE
jgi:hypothetical protein